MINKRIILSTQLTLIVFNDYWLQNVFRTTPTGDHPVASTIFYTSGIVEKLKTLLDKDPEAITATGIPQHITQLENQHGIVRPSYHHHGDDDGLLYTSTNKTLDDQWKLEMYVDADHAEDLNTRKSRMGYIIILNENIVSFASRMQSRVTMSTIMAEYIALPEAMKELICIKNVVQEMRVRVMKPITVYEDNQTCCKLAKHPVSSKRTKHMDIRHAWIREHTNEGTIQVKWIPTQDQLADILSKGLARLMFENIRGRIMSIIKYDKIKTKNRMKPK